jgi:hypothetical protein
MFSRVPPSLNFNRSLTEKDIKVGDNVVVHHEEIKHRTGHGIELEMHGILAEKDENLLREGMALCVSQAYTSLGSASSDTQTQFLKIVEVARC